WALARATYGDDPAFFNDYLHADYIRDHTAIFDLDGVTNDTVSDGLTLHVDNTQGGDGADNQEWLDEIAALDGDAVEIFHYVGDGCGAVRSLDSTSRALVVYLGFGFEAIDNPTDRAALMGSAVKWLQGHLFSDGFESGDTSKWSFSSQ
ncbi:MAG: hypothetical protein JRF63_16350, partial [Deltaproteobacteria bacterium]|nr:hypothetical protein [Deltaproteobacteria bacterium]